MYITGFQPATRTTTELTRRLLSDRKWKVCVCCFMERSKLRRHESELVPEEVNCNMIVQATFLLLFGILFPFCGCSTREQFSLIKISNGTYYLFNKLTNTLREIIEDPLETISCLDFQITDATLVANDFAAKIPHEMPVTSLKQKDTSPDEVLRVIIQKVQSFGMDGSDNDVIITCSGLDFPAPQSHPEDPSKHKQLLQSFNCMVGRPHNDQLAIGGSWRLAG